MKPNMLVKYSSSAGFMSAKGELQSVLSRMGDQRAETELLAPGVIGVETELEPRRVVEELHDQFVSNPDLLSATLLWVPVDEWTDLEKVERVVREDVKPVVGDALYRVDVVVHKGDADAEALKSSVAGVVGGRVNEDHPQKVVRIDVVERKAGVSVLKQADVFAR